MNQPHRARKGKKQLVDEKARMSRLGVPHHWRRKSRLLDDSILHLRGLLSLTKRIATADALTSCASKAKATSGQLLEEVLHLFKQRNHSPYDACILDGTCRGFHCTNTRIFRMPLRSQGLSLPLQTGRVAASRNPQSSPQN